MKKDVDKVIVFVSVMFILVAIVALFEIVCMVYMFPDDATSFDYNATIFVALSTAGLLVVGIWMSIIMLKEELG